MHMRATSLFVAAWGIGASRCLMRRSRRTRGEVCAISRDRVARPAGIHFCGYLSPSSPFGPLGFFSVALLPLHTRSIQTAAFARLPPLPYSVLGLCVEHEEPRRLIAQRYCLSGP